MPTEIYAPKSIAETKKYLKKKFIPFAGGTTLLLKPPKDGKFLDLGKLNISFIKYQKNVVRIGAMTTITELLEEKKLEKLFGGLLPRALSTIGSTLNRNMITVGGNLAGIHPWSVLPGLFLLLNAKIKTATPKTYPANKFFSQSPINQIKNDLITEVEIPLTYKNARGNWLKFSLTATDYPLVSVGSLTLPENIRIVFVGLTLLPQLFEISPDKTLAEEITRVTSEAKISQDIRVSPEYKREILPALVQDVLKEN